MGLVWLIWFVWGFVWLYTMLNLPYGIVVGASFLCSKDIVCILRHLNFVCCPFPYDPRLSGDPWQNHPTTKGQQTPWLRVATPKGQVLFLGRMVHLIESRRLVNVYHNHAKDVVDESSRLKSVGVTHSSATVNIPPAKTVSSAATKNPAFTPKPQKMRRHASFELDSNNSNTKSRKLHRRSLQQNPLTILPTTLNLPKKPERKTFLSSINSLTYDYAPWTGNKCIMDQIPDSR
jgi:hypothetical protein